MQDARDHAMHSEVFSVSVREVRRIVAALKKGKSLAVVGTTSSRTLESLYWIGVKKLRGHAVDQTNLTLEQFEWIPLQVGEPVDRIAALESLLDERNDDDALTGSTSLMIIPETYEFRMVDHLMTNFHAPDSTLMLLVSAFLDITKIRSVYGEAAKRGFKFLSYGDACLFSKPTK